MDHAEECPSYYVDCWGTICDCDYMHICMCRELRACEERVLNEYRQQHDGISERYFQQIRIDALRDAREAVAALGNEPQPNHDGDPYSWSEGFGNAQEQALAAIDALMEGHQP